MEFHWYISTELSFLVHYHLQCHFVLLDKCTCDKLIVLKQQIQFHNVNNTLVFSCMWCACVCGDVYVVWGRGGFLCVLMKQMAFWF